MDTAEALLDAAELLFSERGYAAVGIREIVEEAGVNIAAIKYHFGSKGDLYQATVRRAMQRRRAGAAWEVLQDTPRDRSEAAVRLVRFVHEFLAHLMAGDPSSRLLLREAAEPSEAIDGVVRDFIEPNEALLVSLVRVFAPDEDERRLALMAESVLGQVLHYRVFRPFLERLTVGELATAEQIAEVADHLAAFSLRGIGCPGDMIDQAIADAKAHRAANQTE
jgi:AcrR family transcriptional regulator